MAANPSGPETRTLTTPSSVTHKEAKDPSTYRVGTFGPEVQAACAERQPGEDIWGQLARVTRERNEARGALRAVVDLARKKKLTAREVNGLRVVYGWLGEER